MVNVTKVDREVRRVLRRVPLVGRYIDFPHKQAGSRAVASRASRVDSISLNLESQLFALTGLRHCSSRQQEQIQSHSEQLHRFESLFDEISRQIEHEQQQMRERIEFSRSEFMFEIQNLRQGGASSAEPAAPQTSFIKDKESVERHRSGGGIRINLGCGHKPLEGFINTDMRDLPGVQLVALVNQLPFADNELAEIYSSHLLEHFPPTLLQKELLPYWYRLLRPGGKFSLVVPDAPAMIREYAAGNMSFEDISLVTFGGQEYVGNLHYTMFSTASMAEILERAGFRNIAVVAEGRRNGLCLEFEMTAEKIL